MYYDTIEEAIESNPTCTHVLTTSRDWSPLNNPELKGKFVAAHKSGGSFYRNPVSRSHLFRISGSGWEVAESRCNFHAAVSTDPRVTAARFDQAASQVATDRQIGGDHYKSLKIQPIEYIDANNMPYLEGNVVKYVTRHASKNGVQDIDKAIHYLELIKQMRYAEDTTSDK